MGEVTQGLTLSARYLTITAVTRIPKKKSHSNQSNSGLSCKVKPKSTLSKINKNSAIETKQTYPISVFLSINKAPYQITPIFAYKSNIVIQNKQSGDYLP